MNRIERVLVVEDDPLVAMMVEDMLEAAGRSCTGVASDSLEALSMIGVGGFDAAIVDWNLRDGETSLPVLDSLSDLGVPFVVASGEAPSIGGVHSDRPWLMKPYVMSHLEDALARMERNPAPA